MTLHKICVRIKLTYYIIHKFRQKVKTNKLSFIQYIYYIFITKKKRDRPKPKSRLRFVRQSVRNAGAKSNVTFKKVRFFKLCLLVRQQQKSHQQISPNTPLRECR